MAAGASRRGRVADFLGLERNVVRVSAAMFLMGYGEELWRWCLPKYLEALGAPILAIGLFGTTRDLLDGLYQYAGGWFADRYGRRSALMTFVGVAVGGYLIYFFAPSWHFIFLGLVLVITWASMASPTLYAVIGDALPPNRRAIGFTVQSIWKRVPITVAPLTGGLLMAAYGLSTGVRAGLLITVALALLTLFIVSGVRLPLERDDAPTRIGEVWRALPRQMRWLLLTDIFIRVCEGLVEVFLILYVTNVLGVSLPQFGALVAVQMTTSLLIYVPSAKLADRFARKPFIFAAFIAFALYPFAVVLASGFGTLVLAFVVGGLREVGEPARKALIVDLVEPRRRGRSIGLYYFIRGMAISPAAFVGAMLWKLDPSWPFVVAGSFGLVGAAVFLLKVGERNAVLRPGGD